MYTGLLLGNNVGLFMLFLAICILRYFMWYYINNKANCEEKEFTIEFKKLKGCLRSRVFLIFKNLIVIIYFKNSQNPLFNFLYWRIA